MTARERAVEAVGPCRCYEVEQDSDIVIRNVEIMIERSVAEERERCAKIAEQYRDPVHTAGVHHGLTIAEMIREDRI